MGGVKGVKGVTGPITKHSGIAPASGLALGNDSEGGGGGAEGAGGGQGGYYGAVTGALWYIVTLGTSSRYQGSTVKVGDPKSPPVAHGTAAELLLALPDDFELRSAVIQALSNLSHTPGQVREGRHSLADL